MVIRSDAQHQKTAPSLQESIYGVMKETEKDPNRSGRKPLRLEPVTGLS